MRKLLFSVLYLVLVVPLAYAVRLVRDPLTRGRDSEAATYWKQNPAGRVTGLGGTRR
uniref:Uncharacterized protein n=1 Tax=uncultured bacterium AB_9 TaxID=1630012 RepID=A0A0E3JHU6_9BACT|nr:hypothetical protein [uncultured bacterium AB_9]